MATKGLEDEVPPLEDMSELLQQISAAQTASGKTNGSSSHQPEPAVSKTPAPVKSDPPKTQDAVKKNTSEPNPTKQKKAETFGGFKKGFLFGGPAPKSKAAKSKSDSKVPPVTVQKTKVAPPKEDDIPFIKPANPAGKDTQFQMPEVQEAMKQTEAFTENKDWITPDLLKKIVHNETLGNAMTDPNFMKAIAEFQTNPKAAMEKYKDNPEIQKFMTEFCGLMGQHFTDLSPQQESKPPPQPARSGANISVNRSTNPKQPTSADEEKMNQILSDPKVQEAVKDPAVQRLFETLRSAPDKAQRLLRDGGPRLQRNIQILIEAGLLKMER